MPKRKKPSERNVEPGHYPPTEEETKRIGKEIGMDTEDLDEVLGKEEPQKPVMPVKPVMTPNVDIHEDGWWPNPEQVKIPEPPKFPESIAISEHGFSPNIEQSKREKPKGILKRSGIVLIIAGAFCSMVYGAAKLTDNHRRKPWKDGGSYEVSLLGWKVKKEIGKDYVSLDNNGELIIHPNPYWPGTSWPFHPGMHHQIRYVNPDLDGIVDKIISKSSGNIDKTYTRGDRGSSPLFTKADQKYKDCKEQLFDLIQKAEKAWGKR